MKTESKDHQVHQVQQQLLRLQKLQDLRGHRVRLELQELKDQKDLRLIWTSLLPTKKIKFRYKPLIKSDLDDQETTPKSLN